MSIYYPFGKFAIYFVYQFHISQMLQLLGMPHLNRIVSWRVMFSISWFLDPPLRQLGIPPNRGL